MTIGGRLHIDFYEFAGKGVPAYHRGNGTGLKPNLFFRRAVTLTPDDQALLDFRCPRTGLLLWPLLRVAVGGDVAEPGGQLGDGPRRGARGRGGARSSRAPAGMILRRARPRLAHLSSDS